jgi:hypothetical protein
MKSILFHSCVPFRFFHSINTCGRKGASFRLMKLDDWEDIVSIMLVQKFVVVDPNKELLVNPI